jgi:hypothetical protein
MNNCEGDVGGCAKETTAQKKKVRGMRGLFGHGGAGAIADSNPGSI